MSVLVLAAYFLAVLLVARLFSRRIRDLKDFFLAGRTLSSWPVAFSFAASWFGAASTMGSINAFHDRGLSGAWEIVVPSILSFVVITLFMARAVARQNHLSQPEAVQAHYGRTGRLLLALIILASTTMLVGSQMVAAGKIFQTVFGLDITLATILSTAVVAGYAMWGGYFTVVVTDIAQIALVGLGFLILFFFTAGQAVPDPTAWSQFFLAPQGEHFWNPAHNLGENIFTTLTFVLAWCIAPEMWQRMSSTRSPDFAFRASLQATGVMLFLFMMIMAIGLLSSRVIGPSDAVLVDLALKIPVPFFSALVLLGFVAAVTSTMDSSLNVGSLTLTRDIYQGFLRPQAENRELIWVGRLATVLMVLPAMAVALAFQSIIKILWISADIYASCMFFPVVGLLYYPQGGRWSGILAMSFGGVTVLISGLVQHGLIPPLFPWPVWPYSTLLGVTLSGLGFVLGAYISRRSEPVVQVAQVEALPQAVPDAL